MKLLYFIVLSVFVNNAYSQTIGDDIVHLKSGEKLKGYIIEQKPGQYIRLLQLPIHDTIQINLTEIESILKIVEPITPEVEVIDSAETTAVGSLNGLEFDSDKLGFNLRPYYITFDTYISSGDLSSLSSSLSVLRTFSPQLQAGLGVRGIMVSNLKPATDLRSTLPIFAEVRYAIQEMKNRRTAFLLNLSAGYHFIIEGYYYTSQISNQSTLALMRNGLYMQPSLGFRLNFTENVGMIFDVGYQYVGSKSYRAQTGEFLKKHDENSLFFGLKLFF